MYEYYRARRTTRGRGQNNHEMSLYAGDDSDGSVGSKKEWSNKKKSLRNNPRETENAMDAGKLVTSRETANLVAKRRPERLTTVTGAP